MKELAGKTPSGVDFVKKNEMDEVSSLKVRSL
jgi:hypothetical protein